MLVKQIKLALLDYHKNKGYRIFSSFPLVSDDPTVMFINATITPFKHYFLNEEQPINYAFIQRCFRMGGASELDLVGINPYYHTFFEMFGSGTFSASYQEAVLYLLELLDLLAFKQEQVYFAVPEEQEFRKRLIANNVKPAHIFNLGKEQLFWQEWRFGKFGPVGSGLTVVYSRSSKKVSSLKEIVKGSDEFVELANLIHVYGQEMPDGSIVPANNPGFEFAVGIERLAATLQGCNNYQIDTISPLAELVAFFFKKKGCYPDEAVVRLLTDHLRGVCVLTNEGLKPSNKRQGYVFRKLIRRTLEKSWIVIGRICPIELLVEQFCCRFNQCSEEKISPTETAELVAEETEVFLTGIERAKKILKKNPAISPAVLLDTYGLPQTLISILEKGGLEKGGEK
jgi:alanyl-tRNA synthetase